jgi:MFS family permease
VSSVGDYVLFIALPFYIYQLTGSVLATSGTFIAETAPSLVVGPFAGVLVDRWDRRRIKVIADLLRGTLILTLVLVRSAELVWLVYLVAFLEAAVSQFSIPAVGALVPSLVSSEQLGRANSISGIRNQLSQLVGFPLGGALMASGGLPVVVVVDVGSYFVSAAAMALLHPPTGLGFRSPGATPEPATIGLKLWGEWREGLEAIAARPVLSGLLLVMAFAVLAQSLVNPLLVPLVKEVLGGGAREFGFLATSQAVGGILGGLLLGQFLPHARRGPIVAGWIAVGVIVAVIVNMPLLTLAYALIALLGVPSIAANIGMQTMLQEAAPDRVRGRVFATVGVVQSVVLLAGMAAAGVIADEVGTASTLDLAAGLFALAGVAAAVLLPRSTPATSEA